MVQEQTHKTFEGKYSILAVKLNPYSIAFLNFV